MPSTGYKFVKRYERPAFYMGREYPEYYVVYTETRDSPYLERSNFYSILKSIGGPSKTVIVERATNWLCGWVDTIYIHESDIEHLEQADRLLEQISEYPILDEDDYERNIHEATLELLEQIRECPDRFSDLPKDPAEWYDYARELVDV